MKVHLITKRTIDEFAAVNAQSRASLTEWVKKIKNADWSAPADIQETFNSADLLGKGSNRVVCNIAGNAYRIICNTGSVKNQFVCMSAGLAHMLRMIS